MMCILLNIAWFRRLEGSVSSFRPPGQGLPRVPSGHVPFHVKPEHDMRTKSHVKIQDGLSAFIRSAG
jgi:hypothetical protein